jgi:hypothetical protein
MDDATGTPILPGHWLMPIWDLFRRRVRQRIHGDLFWLSPRAKHVGVGLDLRRRLRPRTVHLVLAHFAETLAVTETELETIGIAFTPCERPLRPADLDRLVTTLEEPLVLSLPAEWLPPDEVWDIQADPSATVCVTVAERHFLPDRDRRVLTFARGLRYPSEVQFHVSLEDELLRPFNGQTVRRVFDLIGLPANEAIRDPSLARRVRHAQRWFARNAAGDISTRSAAEWLAANCTGAPRH